MLGTSKVVEVMSMRQGKCSELASSESSGSSEIWIDAQAANRHEGHANQSTIIYATPAGRWNLIWEGRSVEDNNVPAMNPHVRRRFAERTYPYSQE
jgi:hypothetical protein